MGIWPFRIAGDGLRYSSCLFEDGVKPARAGERSSPRVNLQLRGGVVTCCQPFPSVLRVKMFQLITAQGPRQSQWKVAVEGVLRITTAQSDKRRRRHVEYLNLDTAV